MQRLWKLSSASFTGPIRWLMMKENHQEGQACMTPLPWGLHKVLGNYTGFRD